MAEEILERVPEQVDARFIDTLEAGDRIVLGRYGARSATLAMRWGSVERLRDGLLASALSNCLGGRDSRDLMVAWALHFFVAEHLGHGPRAVFHEIADRLPAGDTSELLRVFGARDDVTLRSFGWCLVQTGAGPDFVPVTP
ncbi:hypothetical protein OHR68_42915 [Spirillospora sp. NBC_00431]